MAALEKQTERAAEFLYTGTWQILSNWFRVPQTPPTLPTEPGEEPDAFKPAIGFLKYLKLWFWIGLFIIDIAILIGWLVLTIAVPVAGILLAIPALALMVLPDIVAYVAVHLKYDTTWYVMSDRSLRIRRGIWIIHEMTFTFENVQNVKVVQGPLQRYFGIADLIVETAGSGGGQDQSQAALNQGRVEGVADAWALRDRIMVKLKATKSAGLGDDRYDDESSPTPSPTAWSSEQLQVLRAIRNELVLMGD